MTKEKFEALKVIFGPDWYGWMDEMTRMSLEYQYEVVAEDRTTHPEDIISNKKIKKSLKRIIEYYSTREQYADFKQRNRIK